MQVSSIAGGGRVARDAGPVVDSRHGREGSSVVERSDPRLELSPVVRALMALVVLVLLVGGISLFFGVPEIARHRWPWPLTPFNTRFLGAIYLAELVGAAALTVINRWSPARLSLPLAFVFTALISVVSLFHASRFDFNRRAPWLWLFLYVASAVLAGLYLCLHRRWSFTDRQAPPRRWQAYLEIETAILGLYGLFMLVAPRAATRFWPWPIDGLHGRLNSTVFISAALGAWLLTRITTRYEWLTLGLTQLVFGTLSIVGLVLADADTNRINWSAGGTWLWVAFFAWLAAAGVAMSAYGLRLGEEPGIAPGPAMAA
jgi:hypothetical protein